MLHNSIRYYAYWYHKRRSTMKLSCLSALLLSLCCALLCTAASKTLTPSSALDYWKYPEKTPANKPQHSEAKTKCLGGQQAHQKIASKTHDSSSDGKAASTAQLRTIVVTPQSQGPRSILKKSKQPQPPAQSNCLSFCCGSTSKQT